MTASFKSKPFIGKDFVNNELIIDKALKIYTFSCRDLNPNQVLFSDGLPSLILMPEKSDIVHLKENRKTRAFNSAWVCCGVIEKTYWNMPKDLEYILVLRFQPACFYSLFGVLPSSFQTRPIQNLHDIIAEDWISVFNEMYEKKTLGERISFLEKALSHFQTLNHFPYALNAAIDYIENKKGNTTVSEVLEQIGRSVNPKWLHRNFVKYIGIPPKRYISLQRFIYTYGKCDKNNLQDLFDRALLSGYYDYSHFLKDFKRYTGTAPSQFSWD